MKRVKTFIFFSFTIMQKYAEESRNPIFFNIVPSPPDIRDWNCEPIFEATAYVPRTLDLTNRLNPIRNQGFQGTSVAQVAACINEWQVKKFKQLKTQPMSPQFIYNNRPNQNSPIMCGREVMHILTHIGCCTENSYPYDKVEPCSAIEAVYYNEAKQFQIQGYARVNTIKSLKKALYINGPCLISFPVYNHNVKMWVQNKGEKSLGGHALTVVGYDKKGFILRNSWGVFWDKKGYCHYPFKEWGCHYEVWTTIGDKSFRAPPYQCVSFAMKYAQKIKKLALRAYNGGKQELDNLDFHLAKSLPQIGEGAETSFDQLFRPDMGFSLKKDTKKMKKTTKKMVAPPLSAEEAPAEEAPAEEAVAEEAVAEEAAAEEAAAEEAAAEEEAPLEEAPAEE